MKKLTKLLFAGALALSFAPLGVMASTSSKAPTQVKALSGDGTEENPYLVSKYSELKQRLEAKDNAYIKVNTFENTQGLDYYSLQPNTDYTPAGWGNVDAGAIQIPNGYSKHLTVNTTIDCRANSLNDNGLLYSFINNAGELYINGTGSIKVGFNASNNPNAIIFNRHNLTVSGSVKLDATQKSLNSYGSAIWGYSSSSKMTIYGGTFIGNNASNLNNDISAIKMLDNTQLDANNNTSYIYGGVFYSTLSGSGSCFCTGLLIESNSLKLDGGTYRGIRINTSKISNYHLSDLLDDGCTYDLSGTVYDGSSNTTQVKTLIVKNPARTITQLNLSVPVPVHGAMPGEVTTSTAHASVVEHLWTTEQAFVGGTSVYLQARVVLEDGYCFSENTQIRMNGAVHETTDLTHFNYYVFRKYYDVKKPAITSLDNIEVSVEEPAIGEEPGIPTISDSRLKITSYQWSPKSTFVAGHDYQLTILIRLKDTLIYSLESLSHATINEHNATITTAKPSYAVFNYVFTVANPSYTVSFNSNGGSGTMLDDTDQYGDYALPDCSFEAPNGKHFDAWAAGSPSGEQFSVGYDYDVTDNVTFYAIWEVNAFTRQPINQAKDIDGGDTEISPDWDINFEAIKYEIIKNGYPDQIVYHKWFSDSSNNTASFTYRVRAYYDETNYVESDEFTLTWTTSVVRAIYTPGDGSGSNELFEHVTNEEITIFDIKYFGFEYEGYVFDYWSIRNMDDIETEVAKVNPGDSYTLTQNIALVAFWKEKTVDSLFVIYKGGPVLAGTKLNISNLEMKLYYEESTFDNLDILQVGVEIKNGDNYEAVNLQEFKFENVGSATLRFIREGKTALVNVEVIGYTVTFNANGGGGLEAELTNKYGETSLPSTSTFIPPSGKQFKGWSKTANGEIITSLDVNENVELFAIWENATAESMIASYSEEVKADGKINLSKIKIIVTYSNGEVLDVEPTDENVSYWKDADNEITDISTFSFEKAGQNNIIVKYKGIQANLIIVSTGYSVSFDSNDGEGTMETVKDVYGSYTLPSCSITAPEGKTFDGWQVNGEKYLPNQKVQITADTVIKALWKDKGVVPEPTYTVSFDANGGTGTMADVPEISGEYTLPANGFTAPEGKEFAGWKVNGEGDLLEAGSKINVTSNIQLVAQWKDKPVDPEPEPIDPSEELAKYKEKAITVFTNYYTTLLETNEYSAENKIALAKAKNDCIAAINAATDKSGVDAAVTAGQAALEAVPVEQVEPQPEQPSDGDGQGGDVTPEQPAKKKGCGGSVIAASALISIVSLAGVALLFVKKKQD